MKRLLKQGSNVVLHYSDKTKVMAQYEGFSDNNPEIMRRLVTENGYKILEEDLTSMWHSAVVRSRSKLRTRCRPLRPCSPVLTLKYPMLLAS